MSRIVYPDAMLAGLLKKKAIFAVVGASANVERPSYQVMEFLMAKGFKVIPINPGLVGQEILGCKVYGSLADVSGRVDIVDVFRSSEAVPGIVREAIDHKRRLKIKGIWMQIGVRHYRARKRALAHGFEVVMNLCPKIEYARLKSIKAL